MPGRLYKKLIFVDWRSVVKRYPGRRCLGLCLLLSCWMPDGFARPESQERININFENVDLRLLIRLVGEKTGKRFVVDEAVSGYVDVETSSEIAKEDLYPLFIAILESKGYGVVVKDALHQIVPLPDRVLPEAPVVGIDEDIAGEGFITKIFLQD